MTSPGDPSSRLTAEQRAERLGNQVAAEVAKGARVEVQTGQMAVVVYGKEPNHTLHLILTFVTCFLWALVWIVTELAVKQTRVTLSIDEWGNIRRHSY